jgi:hypothetical protein
MNESSMTRPRGPTPHEIWIHHSLVRSEIYISNKIRKIIPLRTIDLVEAGTINNNNNNNNNNYT